MQATDGSNPVQQAITVTVTDVNEAPSFTSSASFTQPENTTAVTTVTTTDPEGNTVTYSVTGGADQAKFTIDPNTGALSFIVAPDFEISDPTPIRTTPTSSTSPPRKAPTR